ncbi:hypothetical protein A3J43_01630 [Candidatus Uhrbacteria bacterium RIFCSPHIGHO2_12_FULL_54_23]|uniref:Uncharacterized protein n=2 Tax=Candidatus Uhriibacteriota TaxID=1752732 RepID=A0A1F7ULV7_9BACT|nr:MAG: hypothetical protein A3J43_01630 [Candidatus Uhrbacteria bacterium RIFCSPHIGHO2_12_FULL_54_23]OGL90673.1 MAG: hypothetical protein A3J36_03530 [Candidatus Uhrbacteria bacterium RIFCSPLOWO2_02_FULL_54_37]
MKTSQKILIVLSIAFCAGSAIESIRFFALKGESSYWAFIFMMAGISCLIVRLIILKFRAFHTENSDLNLYNQCK